VTRPYHPAALKDLLRRLDQRHQPVPREYADCPWEWHDLMHQQGEQPKQQELFEA
jgi:hypothetical protein